MRWSQDDYPDSMARLDPRTRAEAIDIANALVEEGYDERKALTIAKAQAIGAAERERKPEQSASTGGQVEPLVENVDTMLEDRETGDRDETERDEGSNPDREPQQSDEKPQQLPYRDEPYEHEKTEKERKSEGKEESPRYGQA